MTKADVRREVLACRDALPAQGAEAASRAIWERLRELPEFERARCVMFFASFGSEVRTLPMIADALRLGKRVALPACVPATRELDVREVCDCEQHLAPGVWGIPEPRCDLCGPVGLEEIDVVVVPGVAFDATGGRVGYGGGFYDGFLCAYQRERPDGLVVALAFDCQVVDRVPTKPKDVPVPLILTEHRAIDNRGRSPSPP